MSSSPAAAARAPRGTAWIVAAAVIAVAALLVLAQLTRTGQGTDFECIWLAGRMWLDGADPYSASFNALNQATFHWVNDRTWVYPPQWWSISSAFALLPYEGARRAWYVVDLIGLFGGAALFWRAGLRLMPASPLPVRVAFVAALFTAESVGANFYLGQTSLIMLLGLGLLFDGAGRRATGAIAAGLFILMLKPSFGLLFILVALATRVLRRGAIIACVATAVACLPFLFGGIDFALASARGFLGNMSHYNDGGFNLPWRMSGLPHLVHAMPPPIAALIATAVTIALMRVDAARNGTSPVAAFWLHGLSAMAALTPLHGYDMPFTMTLVLLLPALRNEARLMIVAGLLLCHSSQRVIRVIAHADDDTILQIKWVVVGGALLLVASVITAVRGWREARLDATPR